MTMNSISMIEDIQMCAVRVNQVNMSLHWLSIEFICYSFLSLVPLLAI